jgi:bacteriocin-like protein
MKKNIIDVKELDKQQMNAIQGGIGRINKKDNPDIDDYDTPL